MIEKVPLTTDLADTGLSTLVAASSLVETMLSVLRLISYLLVGFLSPTTGFLPPSVVRSRTFAANSRTSITTIEDDVYSISLPRPLGITIEKVPGSNSVAIVGVRGNAESRGVRTGDALVGIGSIFGDAIWPIPTGSDAVEKIEEHISLCESDVTLQLVPGGAREACEEAALECDTFFDTGGFQDGKSDADMKNLWGSIYENEYYTGDSTIDIDTDDFVFPLEDDMDDVFSDRELKKKSSDENNDGNRSGSEEDSKPKKKGWFG